MPLRHKIPFRTGELPVDKLGLEIDSHQRANRGIRHFVAKRWCWGSCHESVVMRALLSGGVMRLSPETHGGVSSFRLNKWFYPVKWPPMLIVGSWPTGLYRPTYITISNVMGIVPSRWLDHPNGTPCQVLLGTLFLYLRSGPDSTFFSRRLPLCCRTLVFIVSLV